ncbi:unnamed protein product, partial [Rotaria magnacalcarata]
MAQVETEAANSTSSSQEIQETPKIDIEALEEADIIGELRSDFVTSSPDASSALLNFPFSKYRDSVSGVEGFEKNLHILAKNQYPGRSMGVFTSGGDAQGMNPAVRAIVRMGIYLGCKVYFI